MNNRIKGALSGIALLAGAVALMAGPGSSEARAQMFNYTYGDPANAEAGRGGVQPVFNGGGGYVAVGESFSSSSDGTSDILVVRTNSDGSEAWTRTYDMGGNDLGNDILEVRHSPDGEEGFIITGMTENRNLEDCRPSRDLFLLRIDMCGRVMWAYTYGQSGSEEIGWDVVEARLGQDEYKTSRGDFIVAGSTTFKDRCDRHGYLLRTDARGNLIWDQFYDGPDQRNDYFYSLDECFFENYDDGGDIVAVGGTNSYSSSYDAWIVRVHGGTGRFVGGLHGAAAYGREGFEELRSVQELKYNEERRGDLVATGSSSSDSPNKDVLIMETRAHPCEPVVFRLMGDFRELPDEGYCIRELAVRIGEADRGDVVVTGYLTTTKDNGGHGGRDVFVQTFRPGNLDPTMPSTRIYGGPGTDWGWSVAPVCPDEKWCEVYKARNCFTMGFIVAGFTNSEGLVEAYDPQQLYLIKTNENRDDKCTSREYKVDVIHTDFNRECKEPKYDRFTEICRPGLTRQCWNWERNICLVMDGADRCEADRCECFKEEKSIQPSSDEQPATAPLTGSEAFFMTSYPNPVKSGTMLNVEYNLPENTPVMITVSDVAGKVIHTARHSAQAGPGVQELDTRNWPAGSYMVTVKTGTNSETKRVVVVE